MTSAAAARLLAGRYEVGELIGRGGMAEVHAGYDARLGRDVAIKILRADLARDVSFLQRFRREAQAAATLNHPAIVSIFDSGEEMLTESGGADLSLPFIVMERVHGRTLRQILHAEGPLAAGEAARVMAETLSALGYSHAHGLVHRDVKPANIMVDDTGAVKVMDFGIARAVADTAATMTNTSVVIGTAQYLSPEQAQGHDVDARSDVYGAGCVLYELLTGRAPFIGDSQVAIAYQHVGEEPTPPSSFAPDIPFELDCVVLHALAKDPDERYQDAQEMADDLYAVHRGAPIGAAARATGQARRAAGTGGLTGEPATQSILDREPIVIAETDPHTGVLPTYVPAPRNRRALVALMAAILLATLGVGLAIRSGVVGVRQDVAVPEVVNRMEAVAMAELSSAGFAPDKRAVKDLKPPGTVVSQDPSPGSMRPPSSRVTVFVSAGPGVVSVPDVSYFAPSSAGQVLSNQGLRVGRIKMQDSAAVAKGLVIATDPKAGQKIDGTRAVDLLVSTGMVRVPDVMGRTYAEAQQLLSKVNLVARRRSVISSKRVGTVIWQAHRKERVPSSTEIDLDVVASPPPTVFRTITPSPSPSLSRTPDVPVPVPSATGTPRPVES